MRYSMLIRASSKLLSPWDLVPWQLFSGLSEEGLPDLIRVSIVTVISLIGLTTMAGAIGAGGLGDIAISIGYARFENDVTFVAMIIILILVFAVQLFGDWLVKSVSHH